MANKTRSSFEKRQKEVARQARQKEKLARRLEAKLKKAEAGADPDAEAPAEVEEEDPDLAGIVLGPQPTAIEGDEDEDHGEKAP